MQGVRLPTHEGMDYAILAKEDLAKATLNLQRDARDKKRRLCPAEADKMEALELGHPIIFRKAAASQHLVVSIVDHFLE